MEETKLDKFVAKIFDFTEKLVNFNFSWARSVYFDIFRLLVGISFIFIIILTSFYSEKFAFDVGKFGNLIVSICLVYSSTISITQRLKNISDLDLKILKFSRKIYSEETTKLCFEPLLADWKNEYSSAVSQNQCWQARLISLRYAYAYLAAIFQQSWLGRLVEFLQKIVK